MIWLTRYVNLKKFHILRRRIEVIAIVTRKL
jgi:hypothetical protein